MEGHTKPIITRLLDEPACTLDLHDCKTLSLWAVMKSMVTEPISPPEHWNYSDLDRCLLYLREQIPPHTDVWIAKSVNFPSSYSISRNLSTAASQVRAGVTTLDFGVLAIQVRKLVVPATVNPRKKFTVEEREGPWERTLLQIWPLRGEPVRWPAEMGVNGELGLDALADRFSPVSPGSTPAAGAE